MDGDDGLPAAPGIPRAGGSTALIPYEARAAMSVVRWFDPPSDRPPPSAPAGGAGPREGDRRGLRA